MSSVAYTKVSFKRHSQIFVWESVDPYALLDRSRRIKREGSGVFEPTGPDPETGKTLLVAPTRAKAAKLSQAAQKGGTVLLVYTNNSTPL